MIPAGALGILGRRLTAKLTAPDDERLIEQPASIEVFQQRRDRPVGVAGMKLVVFHQITMGIPVVVVVGAAGVELNKPHAPLHKATGQQAPLAKVGSAGVFQAVEGLGFLGLLREIDRLGRVLLHLPGKLIRRDAGGELAVVATREQVRRIGIPQGIEHRPLGLQRHVVWRSEVEDRVSLASQQRALVGRRHVATRPVLRPRNRPTGGVEHHHEAGQIFIHTPQAIVDPGTEAGRPRLNLAGVHLQHRRAVDR